MNGRTVNLVFVALFVFGSFEKQLIAQDSSIVGKYLIEGNLDDGEKSIQKAIKESESESDQLRFELGVLQFFKSIETLGQSIYEFSPRDHWVLNQVPFLRFPVPKNPAPKAVELEDIRRMIEQFNRDLTVVDSTLAKIEGNEVRLALAIFKVRLDLNDDNKSTHADDLGPVLLSYMENGRPNRRGAEALEKQLTDTVIVFDRADVDWLRGYCCLLRATCETILAYDLSLLWNTTGHMLFERGVVELDFLREEEVIEDFNGFNQNTIIDMIAAIHNSRFTLKEPARLKKAHKLLLDTVAHSRNMWGLINAETDNDHEWIPAPRQDNPFSRARITREMTESWDDFLDEAESILKGEKLIPFWRGENSRRGVNLKKVFLQPEDLDLVLCIQGSGVVPFLETGECTSPETWSEFQRVFRGNFFGFAIWFN